MAKKRYGWSKFCLHVETPDNNFLLKSTLTGAVVEMSTKREAFLTRWLERPFGVEPPEIAHLLDQDVALIVPRDYDEHSVWRTRLVEQRDNTAHIFVLHFLPTLACQLNCSYCFEKGCEARNEAGMSDETITKTREWLGKYLTAHPEIDTFRLVLFGGEPLLRQDVMNKGLSAFHSLADQHGLKFWTEMTSNGELLDAGAIALIMKHECSRVQITLDGPSDIHNQRRCGEDGRPTFAKIIQNIQLLLSMANPPKVNIRISLDLSNADRVPELVRYLASLGRPDCLQLSLGLITPTMEKPEQLRSEGERELGCKAVEIWSLAKSYGFEIPDEFIVGPWCVAIAKHSAILQPNGALQKCFCTVGRNEYDFGTIEKIQSDGYLKDYRFEQWQRTDSCLRKKCPFLPMCGGGCIHNAIVAHGQLDGFCQPFCQRTLLDVYNKGLLLINYYSTLGPSS